ncbi:MAG: hypothetical protein LBH00_06295 [Planctomycetaceae bacterium]|nr:hypothetical protein [Planctomycetaceae bacterium]
METATLESARFMSPHRNVYGVSYRSGAAEFKPGQPPAVQEQEPEETHENASPKAP